MQLARLERRHDGRGNPYYWVAFDRDASARRPGTDLDALLEQPHFRDAA